MGREAEAKFGFCIDCKDGDHEACVSESCRCRETKEHKIALSLNEDNDLPDNFTWEEPPPQQGRHPLTPEIQILLKTKPGKSAHIKHYTGKSSAYQVCKNFDAGKYKDLDRVNWAFRHVKDGVRGPGSDLYVTYIGDS